MSIDGLKQLTLVLFGVIIFLFILSSIRNKMLFRLAFSDLLTFIKTSKIKSLKLFSNIFVSIFFTAMLFTLAFSSIDISQKIAQEKSKDYFGKYNYAYLESNIAGNINDYISLQKDELKTSPLRIGLYYNVTVEQQKNSQDIYTPNNVILGFDNLGISSDQYVVFSAEDIYQGEIIINSVKINPAANFNKNKVDGLDKFRGWVYSSGKLSNKPKNLILVNIATASKITNIKNPNIVFSQKKLNYQSSASQIEANDIKNLLPSLTTEFDIESYQSVIFNSINPFFILLLIAVIAYLILLLPLYKSLKTFYKILKFRLDDFQLRGAPAGIITKYLTYYFFIPQLIILIIVTLFSYFLTYLLYRFFDLSYLFSDIFKPIFTFDLVTIIFTFTNLFTIFFLFTFMIFYSPYRPARKIGYSRISLIRLSLGLTSSLFGIFILFFLNTIPAEASSLIPAIVVLGPITSLLGLTIFLRLKNKYRIIDICIITILFVIGNLFLLITGEFQKAPSAIFLSGIILLIITTMIVNEFGRKEFAKMMPAAFVIFITIFVIFASSVGIQIQNTNSAFDVTFQSYSSPDKSQDYSATFAKDTQSQISQARLVLIAKSGTDQKEYFSNLFDSVSVSNSALKATNLSEDEKKTFYSSTDKIILPPEYKNTDVKEGDLLTFQDLNSNERVTKTVFKIMDNNANTDLLSKVIFPDLRKDFISPRSTLNTIYVIKFTDKEKQLPALQSELAKRNIFDIQNVEDKQIDILNNSQSVLQSVRILVIIIALLILAFISLYSIIKGIIFTTLILVESSILALFYQRLVLGNFEISNSVITLELVFILFVLLIYGANFTYRKIKNS